MPASPCAPQWAISPEPRAPWLGAEPALRAVRCARRAGWLALAWLLGACSRDARAVRLPASDPDAQIYRITCRGAVAPCREKAVALCSGEFEVLQSNGVPIEPPRVSSAPGPRSTGSRYQRPDWVGELVVACGAPSAPASEAATAVAPQAAPPSPTLHPDQLCIPGVTQLCLGPAACRGAQACLADGRGYGACDCGPAAAGDAGAVPLHG
jgi:hypothetical protein